jgi:hypothetical protein
MSSIVDAVKSAVGSAQSAAQSILGTSSSSSPPSGSLTDPTKAGPSPPFIMQMPQPFPGSEADMIPKPDFGEQTYVGSGKLVDRVALITGGDSGIGRAVALAFAREGADVAISYLNETEDAKETERWVRDANRRCIFLPGDISKEEVCQSIVEQTVKEFGRIDILVNNAAFQGKEVRGIEEIDRQRVEYTFYTNILSMFSITQAALPYMKKGSSIINTGSIEAYQPEHFILDYATTKAAIVGFTKGLAQELTPKGIRVNCVAPGPVWTPLVVASFGKQKLTSFGSTYGPMGRPAQPCEIAPAYVFLASQDSSYINAEVLAVTGGMPTM